MDKSERHELSVETAWNAMLDLEKRCSYLFFWDVFTGQQLLRLRDQKSVPLTAAYGHISDSYSVDSWADHPLSDSVERVRPFLGEALYDIFAIHRVVQARSSFALHSIVCEQSDQHWSEDTLARDALDGLVDLGGRPAILDVERKLKRLFCAVYTGVYAHMPTEKPKTLGFRAN